MGKKLTISAILAFAYLLMVASAALPAERYSAIPVAPEKVLSSPGYQVGTTHYDYQTSGPTGNRIVKDAFGGIHVCWMNGIDEWIGNRWLYYNFRDEAGDWRWPDVGTQVNTTQGAGYTNMDVLSDGRGAITYHSLGNDLYTVVAVDIVRGFGSFSEYDVPDTMGEDTHSIWPYVAVDRQERIHITAHEYAYFDPMRFIYTRSDDGGLTWSAPQVVDTLGTCECAIVVASSVDDKVAIVYNPPCQSPEVYYNDVYYIESLNGVNWDWNAKHNITRYDTSFYRDSMSAYYENDAVYDHGGNLHVVWTALKTDPEGWELTQALLYHWSEATGINLIAKHPEEPGWAPNCSWGDYNFALAKPSIGVDLNNNLFSIFTRFDSTDCSAGGYANGEIYGSASADGGLTWGEIVNLTNSPTPGCLPGECDSDHWSSLAETVDDSLYLLYINDKDAGGIPQWEGTDTENPVMYYAVHKGILLPTHVDEAKEVEPTAFALMQNHPNPFNATTEISYQLAADGPVKLEIFNLLGEKVETVVDEEQTPGEKSVIWDASGFSSGTYFCRLTAGELTRIRRMTLLR